MFFHHLHSTKIKYYEKVLYFLINQTLIIKSWSRWQTIESFKTNVHGTLDILLTN
jgi:hypothetical protein